MKILRYIQVAIETVISHKLRAFLTMLGIMIGIASVLTTVGMGRGAERSFTEEIESLGVNLLTIYPSFSSSFSMLTSSDVSALADPRLHPEIVHVIPEYSGGGQLAFRDESIGGEIIGTTSASESVQNLKVGSGRFFTSDEVDSYGRVSVINSDVAEELFGTVNPIGQELRINGSLFQIVGVLEAGESGGPFQQGGQAIVYVPLTVAQSLLFYADRIGGEPVYSSISVQVREQSMLDDAEYRIERTLRVRHDLEAEDENDFLIINQARILGFVTNFTAVLTAFLGSIGAVGLFVGGIGIMNIMLVSVTERTREIGLRKALGAQDRDILWQFLIEALVLCAIGGALGIGLSFGIGGLINLIPGFPLKVYIEMSAVLIALGVAVTCGLVFGLYPAIRATRLDPIEALRYE